MSRTSPNSVLLKAPFDSDKDAVKALIDQGYSDSAIAKKFGVTKDTIWCRRQRWGFPSGWEIREITLIDSMGELWKNGYTVKEIADVLNVSVQMVYAKMREHSLRELPRMGVEAPVVCLTDLRNLYINGQGDEDQVIVVTHNRLVKWALVPIEQYTDLLNGVSYVNSVEEQEGDDE